MFRIIGAGEGILCVGPVSLAMVFPAAYLISAFFPKVGEGDQPLDSSGSTAAAEEEDARLDQIRLAGHRCQNPERRPLVLDLVWEGSSSLP